MEPSAPANDRNQWGEDIVDIRKKPILRLIPKHILCSTDFSNQSNQALSYGISLAAEFDARLYICHVIDIPWTETDGEVHLYPLDIQNIRINRSLDQIERLMENHSLQWDPIILIGHTADEISRVVGIKKIDLVVSATHGRSGIKRLVLGSVTERLMRTLSCPLLIVRNPMESLSHGNESPFRFHRIVIGCDFSSDSSLAFHYGLSLAQEFQSELHLIHVIEPPTYRDLRKTGAESEEKNQTILKQDLEEKLYGLIPEDARSWCTIKTILLQGAPYKEIIRYAKDYHIDLIILGVRGLSLVEALCLGSTTDRVVRRTSCPVLTVRPVASDVSF